MLVWCTCVTKYRKKALINITDTIKIDGVLQLQGKHTFGIVLKSPIKYDIGKKKNIIGYGIYCQPKKLK